MTCAFLQAGDVFGTSFHESIHDVASLENVSQEEARWPDQLKATPPLLEPTAAKSRCLPARPLPRVPAPELDLFSRPKLPLCSPDVANCTLRVVDGKLQEASAVSDENQAPEEELEEQEGFEEEETMEASLRTPWLLSPSICPPISSPLRKQPVRWCHRVRQNMQLFL